MNDSDAALSIASLVAGSCTESTSTIGVLHLRKTQPPSDTQTEGRAGGLAQQLEAAELKGTKCVFRQEGLPDFLG